MTARAGWIGCLLVVVPACALADPHPGRATEPVEAVQPGGDPRGGLATPPRDDATRPRVPWGWRRRTDGPTPWGHWRLGPEERQPYEYDPDRAEYRFRRGQDPSQDLLLPERLRDECAPEPEPAPLRGPVDAIDPLAPRP